MLKVGSCASVPFDSYIFEKISHLLPFHVFPCLRKWVCCELVFWLLSKFFLVNTTLLLYSYDVPPYLWVVRVANRIIGYTYCYESTALLYSLGLLVQKSDRDSFSCRGWISEEKPEIRESKSPCCHLAQGSVATAGKMATRRLRFEYRGFFRDK